MHSRGQIFRCSEVRNDDWILFRSAAEPNRPATGRTASRNACWALQFAGAGGATFQVRFHLDRTHQIEFTIEVAGNEAFVNSQLIS